MASVGLNVARDGHHDPALIRSLGATWVRIVAMPEYDLRDYFRRCRASGLKILLVLARESGGDYAALAARYATLVDCWQIGNESDLDSPSSWTMSQVELAALGRAARVVLPRPHVLVCAGLASGHPEWLNGMDLSWADAVACHPYLKDAPNLDDLEDLPDADELIRAYGEATGLPVLVSEWGWWSDDEPRASAEVRDMIGWAGKTDLCEVLFYFCTDDAMVPPFGLLRADGTEKPKARAFKEQAPLAVHSLWPDAYVPPKPEPAPAPEPAPPRGAFTPEQIAASLGANLDHVRLYWPKILEQLGHAGIDDRLTQIAVLATIAVEVGSRFEPIPEYASGDDYEGRSDLGNTQPGDGRRYKGRGFVQITGRSNYRTYGQKVADLWGTPMVDELNIEAHPDLALDPDIAAAILTVYFRDRVPRMQDEHGDWAPIRRAVNGGMNGWAAFAEAVEALKAVPFEPVPPVEPPVPPADTRLARARALMEQAIAVMDESAP